MSCVLRCRERETSEIERERPFGSGCSCLSGLGIKTGSPVRAGGRVDTWIVVLEAGLHVLP